MRSGSKEILVVFVWINLRDRNENEGQVDGVQVKVLAR